MNQNTMAISAYKEAIKLRPDMTDANMNLGKIYMEMSNFGLAQRCFNEVLKHDSGSKKARMLLDRMQQNQKSARKAASPFGRLVDEATLASAQVRDSPRVLKAAVRNDERDSCRKLARKIRATVRDMVPLLDETLHSTLQKLAVETLQGDGRGNDPGLVNLLGEARGKLKKMHQQVQKDCQVLRQHVDATAEG